MNGGRSPSQVVRRALSRARRGVARPSGGALTKDPTFLIIGAQKGGTRWLRHNLAAHPDVLTATTEVSYFDHHFHRGLDWYRGQFPPWSGERAVGESTPGYMIWGNDPHRNAARIHDQLPDARLFAVLRDPCERTVSAFHHWARILAVRDGWVGEEKVERGTISPDSDPLEYVRSRRPEDDPLQLIAGSWYAASLEPFLERFGDRLLVFLTEEVRGEPQAVYRAALEHLDVDPGFAPKGLDHVRFSNRPSKPRRKETGAQPAQATGDVRAALLPYFLDDIHRLERLLDRDLSAWKS